MSSNPNHFNDASDLERGHGLASHPSAVSVASGSSAMTVRAASNDSLCPPFGATYSPFITPINGASVVSTRNVSTVTLGPSTAAPSIHQLTSPGSPPLPITNAEAGLQSPPLSLVSTDLSTPTLVPSIHHARPEPTAELKGEKGIEEKPQLGEKPAAPAATPIVATRWVKFLIFFNTYRKFFTIVVTLNAVGILLAALGRFPYAQNNEGAFILGNLCAAILVRNEIFGRILYFIVNTLLQKWPPLCVRLAATSALQHLGGIHSGCALSGTGWLIYRVVYMCVHASNQNKAVIATGIVTTVAVVITAISAIPWIRNNKHNVFERHHRFVGWLGLLLTWVFVVLSNGFDDTRGVWDWHGSHVIRTQDFYFVLLMTVFIALPWVTTRKVKVDVEIPSSKVAVLRFERGMQQGLLGRISRTAVLEYHAFGLISEGKDAKYHYMVCGVQGDFTRGLVENVPTHIWTREVKFAGVSNTSALYKRGIRIATGTGIGAAVSTCLQSKDWFLIWIGSDQEQTFGKTIAGLIENGIEPERRILWDTKKLKRPNTMQLLKETFDSWGAEVVFITSNLRGNTEMMEGCKMLGIPAFGTLWDF